MEYQHYIHDIYRPTIRTSLLKDFNNVLPSTPLSIKYFSFCLRRNLDTSGVKDWKVEFEGISPD